MSREASRSVIIEKLSMKLRHTPEASTGPCRSGTNGDSNRMEETVTPFDNQIVEEMTAGTVGETRIDPTDETRIGPIGGGTRIDRIAERTTDRITERIADVIAMTAEEMVTRETMAAEGMIVGGATHTAETVEGTIRIAEMIAARIEEMRNDPTVEGARQDDERMIDRLCLASHRPLRLREPLGLQTIGRQHQHRFRWQIQMLTCQRMTMIPLTATFICKRMRATLYRTETTWVVSSLTVRRCEHENFSTSLV